MPKWTGVEGMWEEDPRFQTYAKNYGLATKERWKWEK